MRTFISHRISSNEKLRAKSEQVENDLAITKKAAVEGSEALKLAEGEKEMTCAEADKLREEGRTVEAKLK